MDRRRTATSLTVVIVIGAFGFAAGAGIRAAAPQDSPTTGGGVEVVEAPAPELRAVQAPNGEGEHIYAIHWRGDDELWYLGSQGDGTLLLNRRVGKDVTQWTLPVKGSPGPHTYLVEAADGVLWAAANYAVIGFDPATESVVFAEELAEQHALAVEPGEGRLEGTWVRGLQPNADGSVSMVRNNVPALFRAGRAGIEETGLLTEPPQGLTVADGRAVALVAGGAPGSGDLVAVEAGSVVVSAGGCRLATSPARGTVELKLLGGGSQTLPLGVHPSDVGAVSADGRYVALGLGATGAVVRIDCRDASSRTYALGTVVITDRKRLALLRTGHKGASLTSIRVTRTAEAIAVSPSGRIAFSDGTGALDIIDP